MKKSLPFSALSVLILFPLTASAQYVPYPYIPSEPVGSRNNPIHIEITDIKTPGPSIQDAQQEAHDTLNKILQDARENQRQLLQPNKPQQAPTIVPPNPGDSHYIPQPQRPRTIGESWEQRRVPLVRIPLTPQVAYTPTTPQSEEKGGFWSWLLGFFGA